MPTPPDSRFDFHVNHDLPTTSLILVRRIRERFTRRDAHWLEDGMAAAERAHAGQYRGDGSPYAIHPFRVALLTLDYEQSCTKECLVSCLLHDVLEDTELTQEAVSRRFGSVVANLVAAVTRYSDVEFALEFGAESRPVALEDGSEVVVLVPVGGDIVIDDTGVLIPTMGASRDVRVIKTFDYCDNLISCKFILPDKPAFAKIPRWLMEAQLLYLPLAERTNREAARLIDHELQRYLAAGHKVGSWL
jgi:(p)ppGpp synthase/HD superfamily hydrolase